MTQVAVAKDTFPALHAAFLEIEFDNGGHLIGTVYPDAGPPRDLETFIVPDPWSYLVAPASVALARLKLTSEDDWSEFVCGEQTAAEAIQKRQGDLEEARELLNAFFDGWC